MPYRQDPRPAFDARMVLHLGLVAEMAWQGVNLLRPGNTFEGNSAWRSFAQIGSEEQWGVAFLAAAMIGIIGVGTSYRWLRVLSILALASALGSCALLFLLSNPSGGASGTFAILALQGFYLGLRQLRWGRAS